jgi:hypothetical protein
VDRFIDDVSSLAIEDRLISKLSTLFRSPSVMDMSEEVVSGLAGETPESSTERQRLEAKHKTLKAGLQSLKSLYKRRNSDKPPEQDQVALEDPQQTPDMTPRISDKASVATDSAESGVQDNTLGEPSPFLEKIEL